MADFDSTTSFILSNVGLVFGTAFNIESASIMDKRFELVGAGEQCENFGRSEFLLSVSGDQPFRASISPSVLARAIRVGPPLIPQLLAECGATADLVQLSKIATFDEMEVVESFTLAGVTMQISYVADSQVIAAQGAGKPVGYSLTIRVHRQGSKYFALKNENVAEAIEQSQPVLGHALGVWPDAAKMIVDAISPQTEGLATAYQADVDRAALAGPATLQPNPKQRFRKRPL